MNCMCLCVIPCIAVPGAAAGQAAVLVALGTIVVLKQQQVQQMAAAFAALPHVRFVWSLKEVSCQ
jgi:hypothetical protein